jgi:phospholipid-translocating ATPase
MLDGVYQSVMVFFIPYLALQNSPFVTANGLDVQDLLRFGAFMVHPAIITINLYILINTYRWDWIMLVIVAFSDLFVFLWTGAYTEFTASGIMYKAAGQLYQQASFWAIFFIVPVICIFPRFAIKALQKVYYPYDVDIVREQAILGQFDHLEPGKERKGTVQSDGEEGQAASTMTTESPASYRKSKHVAYGSVDEEQRPIYPPSVVTQTTANHMRSQTGSDSTNCTGYRLSMEEQPQQPRGAGHPSIDRIRASMDPVRASFEASSDFTSAARLSRIESTQSSRFRPRLRGLSFKTIHHHDDD